MLRAVEVLLPVIMLSLIILGVLRGMGTGARRRDVLEWKRKYSEIAALHEQILDDAVLFKSGDALANQQFADVVINRITAHNRKELAR